MLFDWILVKSIWKTRRNHTPTQSNWDQKWKATIYQVFISFGPLIFCLEVGAMMGFSGIFLPQLEERNDLGYALEEDISSWIASSAVLSMMLTSPLGGYLMEKIGRKKAHMTPAFPGIIGWLTIYFSTDIPTILIGRVLIGISCGLFAPITAAYIGEITAPSIRPAILGSITLSVTLGTLACHLLGTFYHWRTTALVCAISPTIGGILMFFSEESPTWLFRRDRINDAREVFLRIRGDLEETLTELEINLERHKNGKFLGKPLRDAIKDSTTKPEIFKPLLIVVLYFMFAQLAGMNVVNFYAIDIVKMSVGPDFKNTHLIMISMDLIRVITSVIACILLKNLKRRYLVIGGGFGCFSCLIILSFSNFLSAFSSTAIISIYSPLVALLGYVFFISISLVPLPWCLAGELLPQEVKGLAGSILCLTSFFAFFGAVKCAPFLFTSLGSGFTYLICSVFVLLGIAVCWLFLPETKNKTLNEIADAFRS